VNRIPLWQQISNFRNTTSQIMQLLGPTAGATLIRNSIYSVTMGSNDYLNNYWVVASPSPKLFTPQQFQNNIINTYRQQLSVSVHLAVQCQALELAATSDWFPLVCTDAGEPGCTKVHHLECGASGMHTIPHDTRLYSARAVCTIRQRSRVQLQHRCQVTG
jgi:hypothetical protein